MMGSPSFGSKAPSPPVAGGDGMKTPPRYTLRDLPSSARRIYDEGVHGLFRSAFSRHGDVVATKLGSFDVVLVSRPEHIHYVLVAHADNYTKDNAILRCLRPVGGNGIFLSEGSVWRSQRRIVQPEFTRKSISGLVTAMAQVAERVAVDWEVMCSRGEPVDVTSSMREAAMRIICNTIMGVDVGEDAKRLGRAIEGALTVFGVQLSLPGRVSKLAQPAVDALMAYQVAQLDSFIARVIHGRADVPEQDVVTRLRHAKDPGSGMPMSVQQLRDELMTLFIAGHETTATALTWTWLLLARRPDVQCRVQAELQEVLGGRLPSASDLPNLVFTRAVFEETIRLYPPVAFVARTALCDDCIGGYRIAAGTTVIPSIYVAHHREDVFADPDAFVPERFLPNASPRVRPGHGYFPFGAGPRLCMGNHFAIAEAQVLLATLAQRFSVKLLDGRPVRPARLPGTIRPARPLRLRLEARESS